AQNLVIDDVDPAAPLPTDEEIEAEAAKPPKAPPPPPEKKPTAKQEPTAPTDPDAVRFAERFAAIKQQIAAEPPDARAVKQANLRLSEATTHFRKKAYADGLQVLDEVEKLLRTPEDTTPEEKKAPPPLDGIQPGTVALAKAKLNWKKALDLGRQ